MKAIFVKSALLAVISAASVAANAQTYVGGKVDRVNLSASGLPSIQYLGARAVAGYQVHPQIAVEGHLGTGISDTTIEGQTTRLGQYAGVDVVTSYPINANLAVTGRLGVGSIQIDGITERDVRFGVGSDYRVHRNTTVGVNYEQWFSKEGVRVTSLNAGVKVSF